MIGARRIAALLALATLVASCGEQKQQAGGPPPPAVTAVSPASGTTTGGTTVTITGTGLSGATSVSFGGAAAKITADSGNQITVTSPPGKGTVDITVTTPGGTSVATVADRFTYFDPLG